MTTRIVIAEDESIIRMDLREMLQEEGYDVVGETGRGDEAVTLVRELRPDLAVLDIRMPGLDGLAAARQINAEHLAATLILTSYSQRELVAEATEAGVMGYVVKPFQRSDLVPAIEVAIGRYRDITELGDRSVTLEEQLSTRKLVDRAKGALMDRFGLTEQDAFRFIQSTSMSRRAKMAEVAQSILDGEIQPEV